MEWLILCLIVPAVLVPIVLLWGFAGCHLVFKLEDAPEPPPPPTAPVMLVGRPLSASSISLSWQNTDPGTVRVQVSRAVVNGTFVVINDQVQGQSFTDTGLTEGETYLYIVVAINAGNLPSEESNVAAVPLIFRTAFTADQTDVSAGFLGYCVVQTIKAHDFANPTDPGTLKDVSGTVLRLTLRGTANLHIDQIFVSQAAAPSATNPNADPWDSAADLTRVSSNVTLTEAATPLPSIAYVLDPTKDLIVAFDVAPAAGSGDLKSATVTGPAGYLRADTAQAAVANRLPDYDLFPDQVYLVEKIEVL